MKTKPKTLFDDVWVWEKPKLCIIMMVVGLSLVLWLFELIVVLN